MSEAMTINDIINQLGSLRASSAEFAKSDPENEIWQADVAACPVRRPSASSPP